MSAVSNSTGAYLKAHAEIESEGAKLTHPPFEQYWLMFLKNLAKTERGRSIRVSELEHEKITARSWFELGSMAERLRK